MKTLNEMIEVIRNENADGIRVGSDEVGYTNLTNEQYEAQVKSWAQARFDSQLKLEDSNAKAQAKADLLARLGITEDEAKLLLA